MQSIDCLNQEAKRDEGKIRPTLVPSDFVYCAARLEEYDQEALKLARPRLLFKTRKVNGCWKGVFECPFCGNEFETNMDNALRGKTRSCGCEIVKMQIASKGTHGESKTRLYRIYRHILDRCNNPTCEEYKWYGGRGIRCEFDTYERFKEFALSHGYTDELTVERIDVNGNYSANNVEFIPIKLQARNTRNNVKISYKGLTLCAAEWGDILGINQNTITGRKKRGWTDEATIETPVGDSVDVSYVPTAIINAIRTTRLYGIRKYKDPDNWRKVEIERYRDAAFRHLLAYLDNPTGLDDESGMPHLWHLACNIAFLCEMESV